MPYKLAHKKNSEARRIKFKSEGHVSIVWAVAWKLKHGNQNRKLNVPEHRLFSMGSPCASSFFSCFRCQPETLSFQALQH